MQPLLFIAYLFIFCWLITRISFFKNAPLSKWWLIAIFLLKIIAGFTYAWFFAQPQYINTADTWNYYHASLAETDWLLRDPVGFIKDLFHNNYAQSGNLFNNESSYWNNLKSNSIIKLIAVINVFTAKSYYVNIIFFNFLYLFGPVALYRLAATHYPQRKLLFFLSVFLLPSFLFWCSGIHKDGLIFSAMMLAAYSLYKQLQQQKILVTHCLLLLLYSIVLFALRNFVLLLLIPALAAWVLSEKYPSRRGWIFVGIYLFCLIVFFTAKYIHPALNFPQYVVEKQSEFKELTGNSSVVLPPLEPSFTGFTVFLPYAIDMALLRPHWSDIKNISYAAAAAENALLLLMIIAGICSAIYYKKITPFTLLLILFSCTLLLLCGYTVTFAGAVVRYKSIATPLLATAVCTILPGGTKNRSYIL
ncbi:hypothetical protein FC093_02955 [Ilyomonas limi]|uniref:Glycosyltransferase RgtA/B/C/D-like domain-containing protein n=1 Tax=Ilyomonas limi TaxID=2575867 RepID=A0A4U3LD30_9BACT|nr:hypothetical protein [Ilyomonas limi]TKK71986.1 hypothetical protein FC093_02955 [Ilyomonas limi]